MAVESVAVEITPLGAPELGMTRAEMLDYSSFLIEMSAGITDTYYTLLFAYVIAMYMAGRQLTRAQYAVANVMYLIVMSVTIVSILGSFLLSGEWGDYAGTTSAIPNAVFFGITGVQVILVILSVWFGKKIRHPTSELPK